MDFAKKECRMAVAVSFLVAFCVSPSFAEFWYEAYEEALKAISAKKWSLAENKLRIAISTQPLPERRVRAFGTHFISPYVPDYYLGVVYHGQGRFQEALDQFSSVNRSNLDEGLTKQLETYILECREKLDHQSKVDEKNAESERIQSLIREYESFLAKGDLEKAESAVQSIVEIDPSNKMATEFSSRIETEKNKRLFSSYLDQGRNALRSKNFSVARNFAKQAKAVKDADTKEIDSFMRSIYLEEQMELLRRSVEQKDWPEARKVAGEIAKVDPRNRDLRSLVAQIDAPDSTAASSALIKDLESAIGLFYFGKYEESVADLAKLASQNADNALVHFYSGCGQAALALISSDEREKYLDAARRDFASVKRLDPSFQGDRRYVSPRILEIFDSVK